MYTIVLEMYTGNDKDNLAKIIRKISQKRKLK